MDSITAPCHVGYAQTPLTSTCRTESVEDIDGGPSPRRQILPDELILQVLSYFVPEKGVSISTDSAGDICPTTIKSLLQTSRMIRDEISRFPLRIYIQSGRNCQCHTLARPENIISTTLGNAARFPLTAWREIIVSFRPGLHESLDDACMMVQRTLKRIDVPYSTFNSRTRCRNSILCVRRQSIALSQIMECLGMPRYVEKMRWEFVFDGSQGFDDRDQRHERPLWDLSSIKRCLSSWRWYMPLSQAVPFVKFPRRFRVGLDIAEGPFSYHSLRWPDTEAVRERFEEEFEDWWHLRSPTPGRYICGPETSERGVEGLNPYANWNSWPLRVQPYTMEDVEIQGGPGSYGG
ncbi:hypothetical protein CLAIMM_08039 [Cladophialophora immunda]|nr:hypothetical protein CLAIMM_08039 [Cladophialophora immunda]